MPAQTKLLSVYAAIIKPQSKEFRGNKIISKSMKPVFISFY